MAKVLFINPVTREDDKPRHVPYGMALLASIANQAGHQVQVFDANAWRPQNMAEALQEVLEADNWEVVAVGGLTTAYGHIKQAFRAAARHAPCALRVAGGGFLTSMPRDIMRLIPEIDIGVMGEGYVTFPEVLNRSQLRHPDWASCLGIIWRNQADEILLNSLRPLLQDIDSLPYPAWEMFPLEEVYFPNSMLVLSEESMVANRRLDINMSYGCSLICRFCFHLGIAGDMKQVHTSEGMDVQFTYERKLRWHSPRYVINLVKYAHERFGVDFISFLDENLMTMNVGTRGQWLPEICRLWIEEGLQPSCIREGRPHDPRTCSGVHFGGTSHAALVSPEVLALMRRAGCSYLDYGLESFSDRILHNMGKGSTAKLNEQAIHMTMETGIRPIPNQIIGFPDEFFDSIRDNMRAWDRLGVVVFPFFATAYPGSEWYNIYKDRILEQYDGDLEAYLLDLGDATKITGVICENFNAVELLGLRELMVKRNYKRINEYEKLWRALHGEPRIPVFDSTGWRQKQSGVSDVSLIPLTEVVDKRIRAGS